MNYCPYKMSNPELTSHYSAEQGFTTETAWQCEQNACELWNKYFEICSFAVDAFIKGIEDKRRVDEARARA